MKNKWIKYTTILSSMLLLSTSEVGKDARIMIGPVSLSPYKIVEPVKDVYKDFKKIIKKKRKWK